MDGDALTIDGLPAGDWIRRATFRGSIAYLTDNVPPRELVALMGPDDIAFGNPTELYGVSLKTKGDGLFKIMSGSAWGIQTDSVDKLADHIVRSQKICKEHGIKWKRTSAATVSGMIQKACPLKPLTPRFRGMSHAGLHAGPIVHVSGGAADAIYMDRIGAYLDALRRPLPAGGWFVYRHEGIKLSRVLRRPGLIDCAVFVNHTEDTNQLPPLPAKLKNNRVCYPVGRVRGVWPSHFIKDALDRGEIEILEIYTVARCNRLQPVLQPLFDWIVKLPKDIAKPLYTRAWGKMSSNSYWTGTLARDDGRIPAFGLWWEQEARPFWTTRVPRYYRPDLAAWIVSLNHQEVINAVRQTTPETLIACHVDAIWTKDTRAGEGLAKRYPQRVSANRIRGLDTESIGKWELESRGRVRFYAPGVYTVNGDDGTEKVAACGWPYMRSPTVDSLTAWMETGRENPRYRGWEDSPKDSMDAMSIAPYLPGGMSYDASQTMPPYMGPPPARKGYWTMGGYVQDKWLAELQYRDSGESPPCGEDGL